VIAASGTVRLHFTNGVVTEVIPPDAVLTAVSPSPPQPAVPTKPTPPAGAIARCGDGSYVLVAHEKGVCYGHGGVAESLAGC
jgi:hypothetical protein